MKQCNSLADASISPRYWAYGKSVMHKLNHPIEDSKVHQCCSLRVHWWNEILLCAHGGICSRVRRSRSKRRIRSRSGSTSTPRSGQSDTADGTGLPTPSLSSPATGTSSWRGNAGKCCLAVTRTAMGRTGKRERNLESRINSSNAPLRSWWQPEVPWTQQLIYDQLLP
jgi:hypothetical protein